MKKGNSKFVLIWLPFLIFLIFLFKPEGAILFGVVAGISCVPAYVIAKLLKIDINVYYDHKGKRISKQEYDKLEVKYEMGFHLFPHWKKK